MCLCLDVLVPFFVVLQVRDSTYCWNRTAFYLLSEPISHITTLCCIHSCPEMSFPLFLLLLLLRLQSHSINRRKVSLKDAGQVRKHMASTWQTAVLPLLLIDSGEWQEWVRGDTLEEQQTSASLVAPWPVLWKCLSDDGCLKMSVCMCVCVCLCVWEKILSAVTGAWLDTLTLGRPQRPLCMNGGECGSLCVLACVRESCTSMTGFELKLLVN